MTEGDTEDAKDGFYTLAGGGGARSRYVLTMDWLGIVSAAAAGSPQYWQALTYHLDRRDLDNGHARL